MNLTGIGYDVHRFGENRALILGGVEIPHTHGLDGHSDADVLVHAIADAVLGAIGERDIGHHFPNSDESIRGISSLEILRKAGALVGEKRRARDQHRRHAHRRGAKDRAACRADAREPRGGTEDSCRPRRGESDDE